MLAVLTVRLRFDDPDMWWHLKTGEVIWKTHSIPTTDLFSYTTNHHAWIDHEWLSQLMIYGAYRLGGYTGLMLWLCLFTAGLLIGGYALCSLYSGNAKVALVGGLTIWLFGTIGFAIRPHMIGYSLLLVELIAAASGANAQSTLVPGTSAALCTLGQLPRLLLSRACPGRGNSIQLLFQLSQWLTGSNSLGYTHPQNIDPGIHSVCRRLFANPVGVKLVLYPLETMLVPSIGVAQVTEWQPLQFGDGRSLAFLGVLGCIALLVIVRQTELRWQELVMLAVGTWLAASHQRLLFIFGILAAPVLARLLSDTWDNYDAKRDRADPKRCAHRGIRPDRYLGLSKPLQPGNPGRRA